MIYSSLIFRRFDCWTSKLYDLLVKGQDKELEHYSEVRKEIMDYSEEAQYKVEQAINKLNRIGSVATIIEEYEKSKRR